MFLGEWEGVREQTLTLPSELPFWELDSRWTFKSSRVIVKVKTLWIEKFFISLEISWNVNV